MAAGTKLNRTLISFIESQNLFFVATAAKNGRVNVSPKGMDTLKIVNENSIQWLNLTGSGNETAAHVLENQRMTLMFCAFEGEAKILRVYGKASVMHPRDSGWNDALNHFSKFAGSRQIFDLSIDLIQISCGTGVPIMPFQGSRGETELLPFYDEMGEEGVKTYWGKKNSITLDGLPTGIFEDT